MDDDDIESLRQENQRLRDGLRDIAKALWLLEDKGFISANYDDQEEECSHLRAMAKNAVEFSRGLSGPNVEVQAATTAPLTDPKREEAGRRGGSPGTPS